MASKNILPLDKGTSLSSNNAEPTLFSTFFQSQLSSQNNQFDLLSQQINTNPPIGPSQTQLSYLTNHFNQINKTASAGSSSINPKEYPPHNQQGLQFDLQSLNQFTPNSMTYQFNKDNLEGQMPFHSDQISNCTMQNEMQRQFISRNEEQQHPSDNNSNMTQVNQSMNAEIINELQSQINSIKKVNDIQKETLDKLMNSIQLFSNEITNHKRINEMYKAKLSLSFMSQNQTAHNPLNLFGNYNQSNNPSMNLFQFQSNQHIQETHSNPLNLNQDMKGYQDEIFKPK